jgi:hypothetical protein
MRGHIRAYIKFISLISLFDTFSHFSAERISKTPAIMKFQLENSASGTTAIVKGGAHAFIKNESVIFTVAVILLETAMHTYLALDTVRLTLTAVAYCFSDIADLSADFASAGEYHVKDCFLQSFEIHC